MRRITTILGAMALAVAACAGTSPTPTPNPATPTPVQPTAAPVTVAPQATLLPISAAVTFDGKTCTYSGPTVIPRDAAITFTMTNTPAALQGSVGAALIVGPVVDGTTWQQILDYMATNPVSKEPDWVFLPGIGDRAAQILYPESAAAGTTMRVVPTMELDYLVICGTPPDETDKGYPAILLHVLPKA
jgi:hypothetical protein